MRRPIPGPRRQAAERARSSIVTCDARRGSVMPDGPAATSACRSPAPPADGRASMPVAQARRARCPSASNSQTMANGRSRWLVASPRSIAASTSGSVRTAASRLASSRSVREPPLADDAVGVLGDDAQHAADCARIVGQRAVGEGVVGLLGIAVALKEQQQALVPGGLAGAYDGLGARADVGPDSAHTSEAGRPSAHGCFAPSVIARVGIVVEERQLRPPAEPHRIARRDQDAQHGPQALRPGVLRSERACRPVLGRRSAQPSRHRPSKKPIERPPADRRKAPSSRSAAAKWFIRRAP